MRILETLLKKDGQSAEVELIRLWILQISILLGMSVSHMLLDTNMVGAYGTLAIATLNVPVIFLTDKTSNNSTYFIYSSLVILTLSIIWYMVGNGGLSSPMAAFALGVPGVALYFLGKKHFIIWFIVISAIYVIFTFIPPTK